MKIIDCWGNELRYRSGAAARDVDYDLWSEGADGLSDLEDATASGSLDDIP